MSSRVKIEVVEHSTRKYGPSADIGRSQQALQARGESLGFRFDFQRRSRIYNTFDAHRLLHWAGSQGGQPTEVFEQALRRSPGALPLNPDSRSLTGTSLPQTVHEADRRRLHSGVSA